MRYGNHCDTSFLYGNEQPELIYSYNKSYLGKVFIEEAISVGSIKIEK